MSFSQPAYLALLILIPLGVLFFLWRNLARQQTLRQMGDEALVSLLIQRISLSADVCASCCGSSL